MEKDTLVKEIMWCYDYTKKQAKDIVEFYEEVNRYDDLCDLIITKKELSMDIHNDV